MSEKAKTSTSPAKELYGDYKLAVDRYNSYAQPTFKNMVRRALAGGNYVLWEDDAHNNKIDAQRAAKEDLQQHYDEHVQEAIHDATAEGVVLNLPEDGHVEMATNVQQLPVAQAPMPKA